MRDLGHAARHAVLVGEQTLQRGRLGAAQFAHPAEIIPDPDQRVGDIGHGAGRGGDPVAAVAQRIGQARIRFRFGGDGVLDPALAVGQRRRDFGDVTHRFARHLASLGSGIGAGNGAIGRFGQVAGRVGKLTNYDRLIVEIWTDGTVSPEMALVEAAKIYRKHLNPFVLFENSRDERPVPEDPSTSEFNEANRETSELQQMLSASLTELEAWVDEVC